MVYGCVRESACCLYLFKKVCLAYEIALRPHFVEMAVFYNVETIHPNFSLLNDRDDNDVQTHPRTCFCVRCRAIEVGEIHDRFVDERRMLETCLSPKV